MAYGGDTQSLEIFGGKMAQDFRANVILTK